MQDQHTNPIIFKMIQYFRHYPDDTLCMFFALVYLYKQTIMYVNRQLHLSDMFLIRMDSVKL